MFASKTAEDLPWRAGQAVTVTPATLNGQQASIVVREYVQYNQPNPILTAIRARTVTAKEVLAAFAPGYDNFAYPYSPAEIQHAVDVLSRRARIYRKEAS